MLYVLLLYLYLYLSYFLYHFYISTYFIIHECMFSYHRKHLHPRQALLPPDLQICSTMVLTDIISDVFALLTPTLIPTCKRTYAHAPHTSTFIHASPRSPPHTRKHTSSYLVFPFPIYLLLHPYIPVHAHPTTSTHIYTRTHIFPLDLYPWPSPSFRLLFPDQVVSTL